MDVSIESHVAQADICWECAQPTGVFQRRLLEMVTIPAGGGWQDGALRITWGHHTAHGMHISQEEVSGSVVSSLPCSLPAVLVLPQL